MPSPKSGFPRETVALVLSTFLRRAALVPTLVVLTTVTRAEPNQTQAVPLRRWYNKIQAVAAKYRKAGSTAQTDIARGQLIDTLDESHNGRKITFATEVQNVTWKDGTASITVEPELGVPREPTPRHPLRLNRSSTLDVVAIEDQALQIKPGARLTFTGVLTFHPRKWGAVGRATKSQQMYSLRHKYLGGVYLGTFTSTDYEIKINNEPFAGRWTGE